LNVQPFGHVAFEFIQVFGMLQSTMQAVAAPQSIMPPHVFCASQLM
jgi:hypothetical protein